MHLKTYKLYLVIIFFTILKQLILMGKDMFCFVFDLKQNLTLMPVSYKSEFQGFLFIVFRKAFLASWPYFVFIKLQIFLQITSMHAGTQSIYKSLAYQDFPSHRFSLSQTILSVKWAISQNFGLRTNTGLHILKWTTGNSIWTLSW